MPVGGGPSTSRPDDGSAVDIQGTRVLNNDGIHGFGGPSTTVAFTAPGLYAIDIPVLRIPAHRLGPRVPRRPRQRHAATALTDRLWHLVDYAAPATSRLTASRAGARARHATAGRGAAERLRLQCRPARR